MRFHTTPARAGRALLVTLLLAIADRASARTPWWSVDGGGAIPSTQSGGGYRVGGTAGQPDAGTLTGGAWRLRGGFWSFAPGIGWVGAPTRPATTILALRLAAPSPNPAAGPSTVRFELPHERDVVVRVLDVGGRLVRELDHARRAAGAHQVVWDGLDTHGAPAASGLYFVHLQAGSDRAVTRLVRLAPGDLR